MRTLIYIALILVICGCKNELAIEIPPAQPVSVMKLDSVAVTQTTLTVVGEFSGKLSLRTIFTNQKDELVKHFPGTLTNVDEKTQGAYFVLPAQHSAKAFSLYLWINMDFYKEQLKIDKLILSSPEGELVIPKQNFEELFEFTNLTFNADSGEFRPVSSRPIPQMELKYSIQELMRPAADTVVNDSITLPISPKSNEIPTPDTTGNR